MCPAGSLTDASGRILVPGIYDHVAPVTEEERELCVAADLDLAEFRRGAQVERFLFDSKVGRGLTARERGAVEVAAPNAWPSVSGPPHSSEPRLLGAQGRPVPTSGPRPWSRPAGPSDPDHRAALLSKPCLPASACQAPSHAGRAPVCSGSGSQTPHHVVHFPRGNLEPRGPSVNGSIAASGQFANLEPRVWFREIQTFSSSPGCCRFPPHALLPNVAAPGEVRGRGGAVCAGPGRRSGVSHFPDGSAQPQRGGTGSDVCGVLTRLLSPTRGRHGTELCH